MPNDKTPVVADVTKAAPGPNELKAKNIAGMTVALVVGNRTMDAAWETLTGDEREAIVNQLVQEVVAILAKG